MPSTTAPMMAEQKNLPVYAIAAVASLLLSLWQIAQIAQINHDAVYYLLAIQGDTASIEQIGHWLFYPTLIHWISLLTGLEAEIAAHGLNIFLDLLLVLAFLRLVEELGGERRTLVWAALVVLSLPYLNDNRSEIIRDHGYWALTLVAMIFYIRLYRRFSWVNLLLWNASMLLATLFRVEGVVFLALMPLGLLTNSRLDWSQRWKNTAIALLPLAGLVLGFGLVMLISDGFQNRLVDTLSQAEKFIDTFSNDIPQKAALLKESAVPEFSLATAQVTLYLGIIYSILKDMFSSLSWLYAIILLARHWFPATGLSLDTRPVIAWYAIISLGVLFLHGAQHFIMVSRYTMSLSLVLLPVVVFSLSELQRKALQNSAFKTRFGIVAFCMLLLFADSLIGSSKPKLYILDAAQWASQHLPDKARVLTDYHPERVGYYTNRNNDKQIRFQQYRPGKTKLDNYDYAFVRTKKDRANSTLQQRLYKRKMKPIKKISNGRQGVIIYKLRQ